MLSVLPPSSIRGHYSLLTLYFLTLESEALDLWPDQFPCIVLSTQIKSCAKDRSSGVGTMNPGSSMMRWPGALSMGIRFSLSTICVIRHYLVDQSCLTIEAAVIIPLA